jgi:hypothetical protein
MADTNRRLVERIMDPSYLGGLETRSLEELRQMDDEAREAELEVSFERRLYQARIDIVTAELDRREKGDSSSLVDQLAQILASDAPRPESDQPLPSRAPDLSRIPRNADVPRRREEEVIGETTLARLPRMSTDEVREALQSLKEREAEISERRKKVHRVVDLIQERLVEELRGRESDTA